MTIFIEKVTKKGKFVMGMAAGQARLLSITARLSDNELRAQIINNDKMRLATQSSQVSESYVQALNDAQMMFSNYDANNNASYQELTFNALTQYNPYNNQYALSNASGQILLSETDAYNYEKSGHNLNNFLAAYGLEQDTSYFESIAQPKNADGTITYPNIYGEDIEAGKAKYLKAMYMGTDGYTSYENIVGSEEYYEFSKAYESLEVAEYERDQSAYPEMLKQLKALEIPNSGDKKITFDQLLDTEIKAPSTDEEGKPIAGNVDTILDQLASFIGSDSDTDPSPLRNKDVLIKDTTDTAGNTINTGTTYLNLLHTFAQNAKDGWASSAYTTQGDNILKDPISGNIISGTYNVAGLTLKYNAISGFTFDSLTSPYEYTETETEKVKGEDGKEVENTYTTTYKISGNTITISENGADSTEEIDLSTLVEGNTYIYKTQITDEEKVDIAKSIISAIKNNITDIWDVEKFAGDHEKEVYNRSAATLLNTLGFANITSDPVKDSDLDPHKETLEQLKDILGNYDVLRTKLSDDNLKNFDKIRQALLLDAVQNTYGEPKITWIDKKDTNNGNPEAKATWYENLFNRIESGGYHTLKDGLASSAEWIKTAFESGTVTMEQVDSIRNWNKLIYTNCSDITEQTNTAAVTKAEAEYNAAMKKIENKDKMYDLELKNIDTEHNSLQTEYDSIKSAIDKNIERSFKLYNA